MPFFMWTSSDAYPLPEVHDDAGRGLVWTGESSRASQRALAGLVRYYGDAGVLVLVRALLQREGRLSYRSLTRICGLDEAGLADIREDLIFQRLARDEDGKGLVWIGSAPPPAWQPRPSTPPRLPPRRHLYWP
jgi:hypothetical protein